MPEPSGESLRAYVGMGSNVGDRAGNLLLGVRGMLSASLRVVRLSSVYETEPVGVHEEQRAYLNAVAELGPPLPRPEELLARLLKVEYALGRRRARALAARTLDLDLLLYGVERVETPLLTLPHPRMHLRRFALKPLCELAPAAVHPVLNKSCAELLAESDDRSRVRLWKPSAGENGR
ncbi:MAG TPA: 2-amino-4-hydroxy-6-hydroxymethyldihydropteridine diphosphokinase [Pyrinomonadaceae bacterium]|jgi:2-amino-4-hydroxy-6-hydroxymethyldihydropteridine diphosphokinase|nr:2-amino-4-hydroxy-6-hydroxymethyldihydropteridine diphosphokinase [Pyrinomonadaceae bacterium]